MGMASCKECIHAEFCFLTYKKGSIANCEFKDRSNFVEVVRCKDCKHRENVEACPMCYELFRAWDVGDNCSGGEWELTDHTQDYGFCSYGERREGE